MQVYIYIYIYIYIYVHDLHSNLQTGRPYEDVGARQQRRRRQQIKERVTNYL